ncbi:hypothetical protein [Brevundimonas vesicularis]|uniref:hypothetical protein n=1 Tax=Brevundimonas vesicularis TaxID=41276 RepID=UPI0038D386A0
MYHKTSTPSGPDRDLEETTPIFGPCNSKSQTRDDITADAVCQAFGVEVAEHPDALAVLARRYGPDDFNAAHRRMARIAAGGVVIANPVTDAPGFQIDNVFVKAHPDLSYGSYPFGIARPETRCEGVGTELTIRGRKPTEVDVAEHELSTELRYHGIKLP